MSKERVKTWKEYHEQNLSYWQTLQNMTESALADSCCDYEIESLKDLLAWVVYGKHFAQWNDPDIKR